jgi:hypothetical protein
MNQPAARLATLFIVVVVSFFSFLERMFSCFGATAVAPFCLAAD